MYEPKEMDGVINDKYVDLLDEDRSIANQKYVCVSFVSPETVLKQKELFFFESFVDQWQFTKATEKYTQFFHFLAFKYSLNFDAILEDFTEFMVSEKGDLMMTTILDDYKTYKDQHEEALEAEFGKTVDFQTSTRGLKVRGVYPTQEEAELRCKLLREVDPNHDVYVGPVGMWMPWEPEAYKTGRVEYLEDELNQLMHEKQKNEVKAKQEFDKRVLETKHKAIEENKKKAAESGNLLSQNIDKDGNLYSVDKTGKNNEISVEDMRKELFESDDVVIGESDHGLSRLTENQPKEDTDHPSDEEDEEKDPTSEEEKEENTIVIEE
jgi:hypothetical protein